VALSVDLEEAAAAAAGDSTAGTWAGGRLAMYTSERVVVADLAAAFEVTTSTIEGFIISMTIWDSLSIPTLPTTTTSRMSPDTSMIHTAMSTRPPTILGIATRVPDVPHVMMLMRSQRLLSALLFAFVASAAPVLAETSPAPIDDSSQLADLGNDRADQSVIDDASQAADLGNDRADWATITDESQTDDLH
jgi:hypothetical protein